MHARRSGVADHYAADDRHALALARRCIANLNTRKSIDIALDKPREPAYPTDEIDGIVPVDLKKQYDVRDVIARLVDASELDEFKQLYGTTLVTGFARIHVSWWASSATTASPIRSASRPRISSSCAASAAPLLFLGRTSSASWWAVTTRRAAASSKDGAKMVRAAVACAQVPKTVIVEVLRAGSNT